MICLFNTVTWPFLGIIFFDITFNPVTFPPVVPPGYLPVLKSKFKRP